MLYTIYKIECNEPNECIYIGSTKNFTNRKCQHKSDCHNENSKHYNYQIYCKIREFGGWPNWSMVPIEQQECDTKLQSCIREQDWINDAKNNGKIILNSQNAQTDSFEYHKQYYQNNIEQIREQQNQYKQDHKEQNKLYQQQYRQKKKAESIEPINIIV